MSQFTQEEMQEIKKIKEQERQRVGRNIKSIRYHMGMTQPEAARIFGVSPRTWQRYESGTTNIPMDIAMKVSKHFGVSTDYLYFHESNW